VAVPVLALWAAAPVIAYALSRPVPSRRAVLGAEDREFLRGVALATWRYFETFVGPEDHGLPPDNVQIVPQLTVAHRTSPTNIGMGLLATLAAHDFGFIDTEDLVNRIETTLTTVESLERFEGHLLNRMTLARWRRLRHPMSRTVDSGNLAGTLLTPGSPVRAGESDRRRPRRGEFRRGSRACPASGGGRSSGLEGSRGTLRST
jgi:cyclic beta-1,2-glucan synthetase